MRVVVDIGHPAHVHFFKNFIWEMKKLGHDILITATDKESSQQLLRNYDLEYVPMGTYGRSFIKKLVNIPLMDLKMWKAVSSFKPDIFVGISAIRAAHVAWFMRKPSIIFDDTEHSKWERLLYQPFASVICTPSCFAREVGKKQRRYNGYHELAYLHPNYFTPDESVLRKLSLSKGERFVVIRFVAWQAGHDIGQSGLDIEAKRKLVEELGKYAKIIISSEGELTEEFKKYELNIPPENIHDVLSYASLYIGEGATMAAEAAVLGTPAIYVNTLQLGYLQEQEDKYGLVYNLQEVADIQKQVVDKASELIQKHSIKDEWQNKRNKLLRDKIDVTEYIVDIINNYSRNKEY